MSLVKLFLRSTSIPCTDSDTKSFTCSTDLDCIELDGRHAHALAAQLLLWLPFCLVANSYFESVFACLLAPTTHLGALRQNLTSSNCQWICHNEELRKRAPRSGLVFSTCAILDLVWSSVALPTSESRTSRDPVVTRQQAAERARRLLQHVTNLLSNTLVWLSSCWYCRHRSVGNLVIACTMACKRGVTNVIQRQHPAIHQLFFCMLRQQKRRLIGACMLAPCLVSFLGQLRPANLSLEASGTLQLKYQGTRRSKSKRTRFRRSARLSPV